MLKLTHTQAATVAKLCAAYSELILAKSNAHDWYIVHHGNQVLTHLKTLGYSKLLGNIESDIAAAQKRIDHVRDSSEEFDLKDLSKGSRDA